MLADKLCSCHKRPRLGQGPWRHTAEQELCTGQAHPRSAPPGRFQLCSAAGGASARPDTHPRKSPRLDWMPRIPGRPCWHEQPSPASQICQTRNVPCDRTPWSQGGQASSLSSATSFFSLDMRRFGSSSCREQTEAGNPGQNTKQSKFLVYPGIVGDLSNSLGKTLVQSFGPRFCRPACTAGMQRHVEMDSGMLEACRPHHLDSSCTAQLKWRAPLQQYSRPWLFDLV